MFRIRALALLLAGLLVAVGLPGAPAASAASTKYKLITEPADNYQAIYSLINSATNSLNMTMYELTDTVAEQDLANAASRGVNVRVILDINREQAHNQPAYT